MHPRNLGWLVLLLLLLTGSAITGSVGLFTSSSVGTVPASGGGTTNFLRADGIWAAPAGGSESEIIVQLPSDVVNATTTPADITGLSFSMAANKDYLIEAFLPCRTAATTTGIWLGMNGPASPVEAVAQWYGPTAVTTFRLGGGEGYDNTAITATAGFGSTTQSWPFRLWALVRNGANAGTFVLRFRSEVGGSAITIRAGSVLRWRAIN